MKKLMSIAELVKEGYPRVWLYQVAHSKDFVEAGGRRLPTTKSKIFFDTDRLDKYLEKITEENI